MKSYMAIVLFVLLAACSSGTQEEPVVKGHVRVNLATEGGYEFEHYIRSLTIYAFSKNAEGKYTYYKTIENLDIAGIRQLETGISLEKNVVSSRVLDVVLPLGSYRFYIVGNVVPQSDHPLEAGITGPGDIYLMYPVDGVDIPYFLGSGDVDSKDNPESLSVVLHRAVGRLFVKLYSVPDQIQSIRLSVGQIAGRITLDGSLSSSTVTVDQVFTMKNQGAQGQSTVLFDVFTFPTVGDVSDIRLIFHSKSGVEKTKVLSGTLLPDRYLMLTGEINRDYGSLLSFDFTATFFHGTSWREIGLPDFVLK